MTDFHPRHVIDRIVPDRSDEVAALRAELTGAWAEVAHWKAVAAETALGLGRLRRERDDARRQRDQARAHAQAIGEQQPVWEGPAG